MLVSIRSRTPLAAQPGSMPQVVQRALRSSRNGAGARQRGQDRIGRTAGSTAVHRCSETEAAIVECRRRIGYDAASEALYDESYLAGGDGGRVHDAGDRDSAAGS